MSSVLSYQLEKQNLLFSEINPTVQSSLANTDSKESVDEEVLTEMKERLSGEHDGATLSSEKGGL